MMDKENSKKAIIIIVVISAILMVFVAVGFTIGILSEDPDGLERSLIDAWGGGEEGEEEVEGLPTVFAPLGFIENDYVAGIIGIALSVILMIGLFYGISKIMQRKKEANVE